MSAPESAAAGESATAQAKSPTVIVASRYGTLWLLDAATGGLRWRRVTEGRVPTVAQSEQLVYSLSVAKLPTRKTLDGDEPVQADALSRLGGMTMGHWSRLLALRIADGSVAWQREGFAATDRVGFALDGEILVTDGPTPEFGRRFVYGLDAQSGAVRWNFNVGPPHGLTRRLFGASDGRAYVYPEGDEHRLNALDTRTGEIVWSVNHATPFVTLSQPKGALIVVTSQPAPAEPRGESVHAALTGAVANERLPADGLIALGDDGVAYTWRRVTRTFESYAVAAVRLADGAVLWQSGMVSSSTLASGLIRGDRLYLYSLTQRPHHAEVTALDRHTGDLLWRWRTPGSLFALLALWGWRTPQVILFALAQLRRTMRRARQFPPYRRQSGRRAAFAVFWHNLLHGQWRRPLHLIAGMSVAADDERVYVGTNLGLFAVSGHTGRRLWYALPMMELGQVTPAVAVTSP